MSEWWLTNWPINWVGNSVQPSDPPLETRQNYAVSAVLSLSTLSNGVHANQIMQLTHVVDGGVLIATGRLILTRHGSREY
jgi:hypothetical protein